MISRNKKRLYLVVNGMEISITSTHARICALEDFLIGLRVQREAVYYVLNENEFTIFQKKLEEFVNVDSSRNGNKKS